MGRIIVINWRWKNQNINEYCEIIEIKENDKIILTKFEDNKKFNQQLNNLIIENKYQNYDFLILTHFHNNVVTSTINISSSSIIKPESFKGQFYKYDFCGTDKDKKHIYYGTMNQIGILEPKEDETPEKTIRKENFDATWDYYLYVYEEILKSNIIFIILKKLINTFQPLSIYITGLSEISDISVREKYCQEFSESFTKHKESINQAVNKIISLIEHADLDQTTKDKLTKFQSIWNNMRDADICNNGKYFDKNEEDYFPKLLKGLSEIN